MQRGRCHGIELRFGIASEKLWRQKKNEDGGITVIDVTYCNTLCSEFDGCK